MGMLNGQRAQTAIEVAVFGAILIFALGAIVSSSANRGNQQNAMLKATRMALTMSYITSSTNNVASRNSASVLIVEDRLSTGIGKYGQIDRTPSLMSGSGMHSSNLFMPIDFGDSEDLPVFDLFVNGQHFSLSTSAFKTVEIVSSGACGGQCLSRIWDADATNTTVMNGTAGSRSVCGPCPETENNCRISITRGSCATTCRPSCSDCTSTSWENWQDPPVSTGTCARLYAIVDYHPATTEWCSASCPPPICSSSLAYGCNLSADERFDLNRDGVINGPGDVPAAERGRFAWQWYLVMGYNEVSIPPPASSLAGTATSSSLAIGEGIVTPPEEGEEQDEDPKNLLLDVDEDLYLESIMEIASETDGIIESLHVVDSQDGDVNFGHNDRDPGLPPGFTRDVTIYTRVSDSGPGGGTYLRIEEGQLFAGSQFVRTASKKDAVDIIEREFRLSNHTGRLCPMDPSDPNPVPGSNVEVCATAASGCFDPSNITRTCMDRSVPTLYIRSRIADYHGHKWVTDTGGDPYINFIR